MKAETKFIPDSEVFEKLGFVWKNYDGEPGEADPYSNYCKLRLKEDYEIYLYVDPFWDFSLCWEDEQIDLKFLSDEHLSLFIRSFKA